MIFLIDTCTLLWWWAEPDRLSTRILNLLKDPGNRIFVSAASAWEFSTKYRIGKFPSGGRIVREWDHRLGVDGFQELAIQTHHALRAGSLIGEHRDPFDRMLAAQSMIEKLPVLSPDSAIRDLGAETLW